MSLEVDVVDLPAAFEEPIRNRLGVRRLHVREFKVPLLRRK